MGESGSHVGPLLRQGRRRPPEHGRAEASRRRHDLNVGPAAAPPYPPNYVPDSAPTASAWSSGIKTLDGRLGQGPSSGVTVPGTNFKTYMEIARDRGLATGNVSTAEITDATPAGPSSHISQRGCQGPNDTRAAARRRPRPPAASARSPSSRPTSSSTSSSAAAAPATCSR